MASAYLVISAHSTTAGPIVAGMRERMKPRFLHEYGLPDPIGIQDVREVQERAYIAPGEGEQWFFFYQADSMTREAGNALLKLLEEPPTSSRFFLFSSSIDAIPETLRSRLSLIRERHDEQAHSVGEEETAELFLYQELAQLPALFAQSASRPERLRSVVRRGVRALSLIDRAITRKNADKYLIEDYRVSL